MARRVRIVFKPGAIERILHAPKVVDDIRRRTDAVAAACNADSSWGGYHADTDVVGGRAHGTVWNGDGRNDEPRDQRMLRKLDHGRA